MNPFPPPAEEIVRNSKAHDLVARIYDAKHDEIYNDIEQSRLEDMLDGLLKAVDTPSPKVMELGAGTGNVTLKLLRRGCHVTALDVSACSLDVLKQKAAGLAQLDVQVLNSERLPFADGTFDVAAAYSVLHHVPDYLFAVREMVRVVRRGGLIYIDHEANEYAWAGAAALEEYRSLSRLSLLAHVRMLARTGELSTYDFWRTLFIRLFVNTRFKREGDLHVWPEDHIEWSAIFGLFKEHGMTVLRNVDYLLYQPRAGHLAYEYYRTQCTDTKAVLARR